MLERIYLFLDELGEVGVLIGDFFRYLVRRPFEGRLLLDQLDAVGVQSVNVVNLTAIFSGMVLALQMGQFLAKFGAKIYVSRIMGLSLLREMGPVLSALMVAARVGAGITAELGTMKVTEQIDAMRSLATSPVKKLVVPRVLATVIMMPVLTVLADAIGLLGGLVISVTQLGVSADYFLQFVDSERAARGPPERTWEIGILRLRDRDNRMLEGPVRDRWRRRRRPRDDLGSGGRLDHGADLGFLFDQVFSIDLMPNDGRKRFIEVRQLRKSFAGKPVLQGVDLEVFEGETLVVLGGSGEGKSVMLRHLNGLERPDSGEVIVEGRRLNDLSEDAMADIRKQVAMVFQGGALFDSFTVFDNVSYPLREHGGMDEPAIERRVTELLDMVGMTRVEHLYPAELSGGMKKRVALARSIALQPKAVLYDEPTTGLDPLVTHKINLLIRGLQRQLGFTSVVVTHDLKSAFMVGDRFALLDQGRIRFSGTADEVRTTHDELMREFVEIAL